MSTWLKLVWLAGWFIVYSKGQQCQLQGGECYPLTEFCPVTMADNGYLCPADHQCCLEPPQPGTNMCEKMYQGQCITRDRMYECPMTGVGFDGQSICNSDAEICCISTTGGVNPPETVAPEIPETDEPECGVPDMFEDWRIVHGEPSEHGRWPWQISQRNNGFHVCGGSIINRYYILTAAHCVYRARVRDMTIVTGDNRQNVHHGTEHEYPVDNIVHHTLYNHAEPGGPHDVALIKLARPIEYDRYTKPICLNKIRGQFDYNNNCYITGWGDTKQTGDRRHLQQLKGYPIDNNRCSQKWGFPLYDQHICFGEGGNGACNGDSGGPFACEKNGRYYVVGVASFATSDCSKYSGAPSVYTRVSSYIDWIQRNMDFY